MGSSAKSKKNGAENSQAETAIDPAAQLHEIQKLLFGQQIAQLETVIGDLKADMLQKLSSMESSFKETLDQQRQQFSDQLADLTKHVEDVNGQHQNREALIEDDIESLRKSLNGFENQTEAAHDQLEKQLLQESKQLTEDLDAKHEEAMAALKTQAESLDDRKLDRSAIATLLQNMAQSISSGS